MRYAPNSLLSESPLAETTHDIYTRHSQVQDAQGRVFLIAGIGRPRQYFLWKTFLIDEVVRRRNGQYLASGEGWQLATPQRLRGRAFESFRKACANFVGFREVTDLPFSTTLDRLAKKYRPPGRTGSNIEFLEALYWLFDEHDRERQTIVKALAHYGRPTPMPKLALSIRQPHAEAILRGVKKIVFRTRPTKVRGRVLIYAAEKRNSAEADAAYIAEYWIRDVSIDDDLPRGVLIGSVEIVCCDGGEWKLGRPIRAKELVRPKRQPQPSWFRPS